MASRVVEEYYQQQQHLLMSMPINALIGFRFNPTDIELIEGYLKKRISSSLLPEAAEGFIVDFDIYSCNPWELPRHHFRYPSQQREMFFFTPTRPPNSSSKSSSSRCARTAGCGVWHGNGQDHRIVKNGVVIGHTTSFKFKMIEPAVVDAGAEREKGSNKNSNRNGNRNGNGRRKTDWLMHEYRLTSTHALQNL